MWAKFSNIYLGEISENSLGDLQISDFWIAINFLSSASVSLSGHDIDMLLEKTFATSTVLIFSCLWCKLYLDTSTAMYLCWFPWSRLVGFYYRRYLPNSSKLPAILEHVSWPYVFLQRSSTDKMKVAGSPLIEFGSSSTSFLDGSSLRPYSLSISDCTSSFINPAIDSSCSTKRPLEVNAQDYWSQEYLSICLQVLKRIVSVEAQFR